MKRKLTVFCCIIVSLMLVVSFALAEEWFCPECGTRNEGNFCANCGEKKPVAVQKLDGTSISNIKFSLEDSGDVIVSWDDISSSPPYIVGYEAENDSGVMEPVNSKKYTLEYLIPGETYTVSVNNGKSEASAFYTVPIKVFTDFSSGKEIVLDEMNFSISEVNRNKTKQYQLQVHYPQLRSNRSYKAKLITKTPHGYGGYVWLWSTYELESRYAYIYSNFSMYEFFEGIRTDFNDVPNGRYTLELYFDGELYDDFTFSVVQ